VTSCGPGSSVGIVTDYGLDGLGIESRWGRDFPHLSRPALGPTLAPIQRVPRLFPWDKAAGAWRWPPTPSSAEVKERVYLYLYSLLDLRGLFWGELYLLYLHLYVCCMWWRNKIMCSVGLATDYGLEGLEIASRWGRDFPHLSRPALGPTQPPVQWVPGLSRGYKVSGAWRWPLTPF
jgi:hypothetical protein